MSLPEPAAEELQARTPLEKAAVMQAHQYFPRLALLERQEMPPLVVVVQIPAALQVRGPLE